MPFPLLIPLLLGGASAVTGLFGAHKQGKAIEKAAGQQQQGIQQALAYLEPKYQEAMRIAAEQNAQSQARLNPYSQQGTAGLTALSSLLGVPVPAAAPASAAAPAPTAAAPAPAAAASPAPALTNLSSVLTQAGHAPGPSAAPLGGTVRLRAPTGQVAEVPAHHVDLFLARGATRV